MQNVSDIKLAPSKILELPVHNISYAPDTGTAAGFFSLLKSQINAQAQVNGIQMQKTDIPKNNPGTMIEKETGARDTKITKDETQYAEAKTVERAKPLIADQAKETTRNDSHGANGNVGEKKTAPDSPLKKPDEKSIHKSVNNENVLKKLKSEKNNIETINSLFEGLHRIIDTFNKIQDNPHTRHVQLTIKGLHDFINNAKNGVDKTQLKKTLEKAAAVLERLSAQNTSAVSREHVSGMLAAIKGALAKIKQGHDNNSNQKQSQTVEPQAAGLRDTISKTDSMLEGMKGEGFNHKQGNDGTGGSTIFSLNQAKNDASVKIADAPQAASAKNILFRESLESIIQNARVVVKDSQNASFSVRLHPRELGSVNINLGLLDGVVHGRFLVETQEAKDMLQSNLEHIMDEMRQAGISVGEFQVNVSGQRERLLDNAHDGLNAFLTPAQTGETENEYAAQSHSYHDGYINVLI